MKFHARKRFLSLVLAVLMVVALLPAGVVSASATALSGSLTVDGLGTDYDTTGVVGGSGSATASGNTITVLSTGGSLFARTTILTLTNNKSETATLSFAYSVLQSGTITIAGTTVTGSGTWSGELAAGGSIEISVKAAKKTSAEIQLTNIQLFADALVTTVFVPASNGTFTVDGTTITAETPITQNALQAYTLVATPASGYIFLGWYNVDTGASLGTSATMTFSSTESQTVTAKFVSSTLAIFETAGVNFDDLNDAVAYAEAMSADQITLVSNGTLPAGSYIIPAGITLLVPHDASHVVYTEAVTTGFTGTAIINATVVAWTKPTAYRTLTMAAGAHITVNGAICVGGKHSAQTGCSGSPSGAVGMIRMAADSSITLASGASLYCWGFIHGNGTVTAKSGATVHENFQFTDFRGGTCTSAMATEYMVFPLSQYYVQNVEVKTVYEYGAKEKVWTTIFMSKNTYSAGVDFIGEGAMFVPAAGSTLTKTYDPATDRLLVEVDGDAAINSMELSLGGSNIASQAFPLPINSNISIAIHAGNTTLNQTIALLPGASLTIDQGASLTVATGTLSASEAYTGAENLFIYDADEWLYGLDLDKGDEVEGKFVYSNRRLNPVVYTPTRTFTRTEATLVDAVVDINGTLVTEGFAYTTAGGAAITSSQGTGTVVLSNGAGVDEMTVQANQSDTAPVYLGIPMTSALLKNADGSFTETAGAAAGATFIYVDGKWVNVADLVLEATVVYDFARNVTFKLSDLMAGDWNVAVTAVGLSYDAATGTFTYAVSDMAAHTVTLTLSSAYVMLEYSLTLMPATSLYIESDNLSFVTTTGAWQTAGSATAATQEATVIKGGAVVAGNTPYGFDASYKNDTTYSAGSALSVTVPKGTAAADRPTASFTFTGTGFDIISRTGADQGLIQVKVYKAEDTTTAVKSVAVIMTGVNELYQIPVISLEGLDYGTYTAVITVFGANTVTNKNGDVLMQYGGEFHLDAIRIYNPLTDDAANAIYAIQGENAPTYTEVGGLLAEQGSLSNGADEVFDYTVGTVLDMDMTNGTADMADYTEDGPNNEVYLGAGQVIAFNYNFTGHPGALDLGAKLVKGTATTLKYYVSVNGTALTGSVDITTATALFYRLADSAAFADGANEVVIVIANAGTDAVLSLTDLKVTGGITPASAAATIDVDYVRDALASFVEDLTGENPAEEETPVEDTTDEVTSVPAIPLKPVNTIKPSMDAIGRRVEKVLRLIGEKLQEAGIGSYESFIQD